MEDQIVEVLLTAKFIALAATFKIPVARLAALVCEHFSYHPPAEIRFLGAATTAAAGVSPGTHGIPASLQPQSSARVHRAHNRPQAAA